MSQPRSKSYLLMCAAFLGMSTISGVRWCYVRVLRRPCPNVLWEWYYLCISKVCGDDITMMNYGFEDDGPRPELPEPPAGERYCQQLYHYVATGGRSLSLEGLDVLEVGSGRGGGSVYMARHLGARSVTGCDLSRVQTEFSRSVHAGTPGLTFRRGDAQNLPFADDSFHVVVNLESSHCYPDTDAFLAEVSRVLLPGGHFLFSDIRFPLVGQDDVHEQVRRCGLELVAHEDISARVLRGLDGLHDARLPLIEEHVPTFLVPIVASFAGTKGTKAYNHLRDGSGHYFLYVLRQRPRVYSA